MLFLGTGTPATLEVCTYDARRPEKSGKRITLKDITLSSHQGYRLATVKLKNGEPQSFHPVLMEKFNGVRVTP